MVIQVVQMSVTVGVMNAIDPATKLTIMDQFFLGGPLTLRGFNIKGVGPHEDGLSLSRTKLSRYLIICLICPAFELLNSVRYVTLQNKFVIRQIQK